MKDDSSGRGDAALREAFLSRLYRAYQEEGLYRGVVSKKVLSAESGASGVLLERNLEYLLERGLIRMHKIEDLISISTAGIDWLEKTPAPEHLPLVSLLGRLEKLLAALLEKLETR